jgi:transposase, IS6 family
MSEFKWRHFSGEIILQCVRWYCKYGISYRDLEEMMAERGVTVDHTTLYRWVQCYAPELEKRIRWYQGYTSGSWRVDETYVKIRGKWKYLYRAIDKQGRLIDFMLSDRCNAKAAKRFLGKVRGDVARARPGHQSEPAGIVYDRMSDGVSLDEVERITF